MTPILHHYEISAFSERARLTMGLKRIGYRAVELPPALPKPDQVALTGGYRRAPVLQIGADVYCDTAVILPMLDAIQPEPSLYPGGRAQHEALAWWADKALFPPALAVVANVKAGQIPAEFVAERKAFGFNLDVADIGHRFAQDADAARAEIARLAAMLSDGRPFLLGDAPGAADLAAYCSVWLLQRQDTGAVVPLGDVEAWAARVAAIGHGEPDPISGADALAVARGAEPLPVETQAVTPGLARGGRVTVTPDDTGRDPVAGELLTATDRAITIRRTTDALGAVHLHFPRAGFEVRPL